MSEQTINPNNLPVVRVVENVHAAYSGSAGDVVIAAIYNGDDLLCVSKCLVPEALKDYDFVWLEEEGVEAMWLDDELIINRSNPPQPFQSCIGAKWLDWTFNNWKVTLLVVIGLIAWWLVSNLGLFQVVINTVGWSAMWYASRLIKQGKKS